MNPTSLVLRSSAFQHNGEIPIEYTGQGENISPPLEWSSVPEGTREFALICEDPDAPGPEPFVHWMLYNISPNVSFVPEGIPDKERIEAPIQADQGRNSGKGIGYMGPLPPAGSGPHHYIFTLYALDAELGINPGLPADRKEELLSAIRAHTLAQTKLVGIYTLRAKLSA